MREMTMRTIMIAAALALPTAAGAQAVQPGRWESSVRTDTVDMPGQPEVAAMMRGRTTKVSYCLTPEQAAQGPREMLKGAKGCAITRYTMVGGRFTSAVTCNQGGTKTVSAGTGSFTPTSFQGTSRVTMTGPMAMAMTATVSGRRVGACGK